MIFQGAWGNCFEQWNLLLSELWWWSSSPLISNSNNIFLHRPVKLPRGFRRLPCKHMVRSANPCLPTCAGHNLGSIAVWAWKLHCLWFLTQYAIPATPQPGVYKCHRSCRPKQALQLTCVNFTTMECDRWQRHVSPAVTPLGGDCNPYTPYNYY